MCHLIPYNLTTTRIVLFLFVCFVVSTFGIHETTTFDSTKEYVKQLADDAFVHSVPSANKPARLITDDRWTVYSQTGVTQSQFETEGTLQYLQIVLPEKVRV